MTGRLWGFAWSGVFDWLHLVKRGFNALVRSLLFFDELDRLVLLGP